MRIDRLPLLAAMIAFAPGGFARAGAAGADASGALDRRAAEARALEHNADLAALEAAVRAADAALRQAGARPNPVLATELEDAGGGLDGLTHAQWTVTLEQPLETGGKRAGRIEERRRAADVARADLALRRRELRAEVQRRFTRALGLQERVRSLEDALATAASIEATVRELVRAGEASGLEELRARNESALARSERDTTAVELEVARRDLAALWGGDPPAPAALAGTLDEPLAVPAPDVLAARLAASPHAARLDIEVERLAAQLELQRRNRRPDVAVTVGARRIRELDANTYVAAVAVPLPLWNRNAGAIAEAGAQLERGRHEMRGETVRRESEFRAACDRLAAAAAQVATLRADVLPNARRVLEGTAEGYRRGKFRLLDLLDARRTLLAAELRWNDALVQQGLALAEVERLVGPLGGGEETR